MIKLRRHAPVSEEEIDRRIARRIEERLLSLGHEVPEYVLQVAVEAAREAFDKPALPVEQRTSDVEGTCELVEPYLTWRSRDDYDRYD